MKIYSIYDDAFIPYGRVLKQYDFGSLIKRLNTTEKPEVGTVYKASCELLESTDVKKELQNRAFGGMPIQIGYCNGTNTVMNCVEYHKNSEINVFSEGAILALGKVQDIINNRYSMDNIELFYVPAGVGVEMYGTTLHYAPINAEGKDGFRGIVVLPKGTNTEKPEIEIKNAEDEILLARNKWLITFEDTVEAKEGAYVGLFGNQINVIM